MSEIYWITRLDSLCVLLGVMIFICVTVLLVALFIWIMSNNDDDKEDKKVCARVLRMCIPLLLILSALETFIPSTKEALMIYGVGGSLEYIKSNDKIKQLPDKCVDAIDMFIDSYLKEDNGKK